MEAPDGSSQDIRHIEKYVDDSFQGVNESGVEYHNQLKGTNLKLQEAAIGSNQSFERYLSLSGGKLALEKTVFIT